MGVLADSVTRKAMSSERSRSVIDTPLPETPVALCDSGTVHHPARRPLTHEDV